MRQQHSHRGAFRLAPILMRTALAVSLPKPKRAANDVTETTVEVASIVRSLLRAPLVFGAVLGAVSEPLVRATSPHATTEIVQRWARTILRIAGVQVSVQGTPPESVGLFVCNHRSYVDILALLSCVPVGFMCKQEVAAWPLIGNVARRMGAVFVDRSSGASRSATLEQLADAVLHARRILVFPEGTTHRGPTMGHTRPGLFRMAETRGFALFPVAIEYADARDAWVGDDTLLRHVMWWLSKPYSSVTVSFGAPITPQQDEVPLHTQQLTERWMRMELERLNHRPTDAAMAAATEGGGSSKESGIWSKR
jgi:lyso-ornithine lipid O-acyltransferase